MIINEKKISKYLETKGILTKWTFEELKDMLKNPEDITFEGEMTGYLSFYKTKSGRRYVQFTPTKCFID